MLVNLDKGSFSEQVIKETLGEILPLIEALGNRLDAEKVKQIVYEPELKSRLKLVIHLIPTMLRYETEFAWDWLKFRSELRKYIF